MSILSTITKTLYPNSVDSFASTIAKHGGIAKANKFAVVITPPSSRGLLNTSLDSILSSVLSSSFSWKSLIKDPRDINILCQSVTWPGMQIQTTEHSDMYTSYQRKVPVGLFHEDVECVFNLTNDMNLKKVFDAWQRLVIDSKEYCQYESAYASTILIHALSDNNTPTHTVKLADAYPVSVNSVQFGNELEDTIAQLSVTFTYTHMEFPSYLEGITTGVLQQFESLKRLV